MLFSRLRIIPVINLCSRCMSYSRKRSFLGTGKKRIPWDKRFPVNPKDVAPGKEGGSKAMLKALPEQLVAPTGVIDKVTKQYIHVKEMVPEFVVPDLTDFELKPYVTYTAKEIKQNELTPKDIFNSVYAADIEDDFNSGKIKVSGGKVHLEDGSVLDLESGRKTT